MKRVVDPKFALLKEPIVGTEVVTYEEGKGTGAFPPKPLPSPKEMSDVQRRIHDITHLPYDPGCAICVSCRRPNDHHRLSHDASRTIPLVVGDYAFPKNMGDDDPLTVLVLRVYPFKLMLCCWVLSKGRDPRVVARLARFFKDIGLTHFAYRSDREPSICAMFEDACALSGRKGVRANAEDDQTNVAEDFDAVDASDPFLNFDNSMPYVPSAVPDPSIESTTIATPEVSHPGESQSNGKAERTVGEFVGQLRTLKVSLGVVSRLECHVLIPSCNGLLSVPLMSSISMH